MITLYIYNLQDGRFLYIDSGSATDIINDIGSSKGFSVKEPPDYSQPWYWIDDKWQSEPLDITP